MDNESLEALARKIDSIELRFRRWKIAVAITGTLLAALTAFATAISFGRQYKPAATGNTEEISAKRFVVVNGSGDAVATLGSWGDGMITGLVLQPNRAITVESKEEENSLKAFAEPVAEKGGAGFFVTSDVSAIVIGGRKGKDGPDWGAGLSATSEQSNLFLKDEPDENGKADNISLGVMKSTGSNARASVRSRSGQRVDMTASEPYEVDKTELPGEASVTLSEPLDPTKTESLPRKAELTLESDGSAGLDFTGEKFRRQARFDIDTDGSPHLDLL